jgi:hypothetical protein
MNHMTEHLLSELQIAELSAAQRRHLIARLARPHAELLPPPDVLRRMRRLRLGLLSASSLFLVPWIVVLGLTLPDRYVARNWSATWIGFDAILLASFAVTAVLGFLRRQVLVLAMFASGVLLICDAWFDVTTADARDVWLSVGSAIFVELPLAVLLIRSCLRIVRLMALRMWTLQPGQSLWRLPLVFDEVVIVSVE